MNKKISGIKFRNMFLFFILCSFSGWIYEVLVGIFETQVGYVNRGFLFGPYLPIYGFGGLILLFLLAPIRNRRISIGILPISLFLVFLFAMFITTVLELFGSYIMEIMMGDWLWDYGHYFLNFQGRIALWSSVKFGIGGVIILYIMEPAFKAVVNRVNIKIINITAFIIAIVFFTDLLLRPFLGSNFLGK